MNARKQVDGSKFLVLYFLISENHITILSTTSIRGEFQLTKARNVSPRIKPQAPTGACYNTTAAPNSSSYYHSRAATGTAVVPMCCLTGQSLFKCKLDNAQHCWEVMLSSANVANRCGQYASTVRIPKSETESCSSSYDSESKSHPETGWLVASTAYRP